MTHGFARALAGALITALPLAATLTPASAVVDGSAGGGGDITAPYFRACTSGIEFGVWVESMGWWADDAGSGVKWVDARFKVKKSGEGWARWRYPDRWQHRAARDYIRKYIRPHHAYRFEARAVDNAGNKSEWTSIGGASRS